MMIGYVDVDDIIYMSINEKLCKIFTKLIQVGT